MIGMPAGVRIGKVVEPSKNSPMTPVAWSDTASCAQADAPAAVKESLQLKMLILCPSTPPAALIASAAPLAPGTISGIDTAGLDSGPVRKSVIGDLLFLA